MNQPTPGRKTNHTIYHKGKGSLGIDNYTLYMADRISWRKRVINAACGMTMTTICQTTSPALYDGMGYFC